MEINEALNKLILEFFQNNQPIQVASWLRDIAQKYGYFGVFLTSFLGTLSIVFPIPYTIIIFMLGGLLDPNLLALSAGAGSVLGEIVGYLIGYYGFFFVSDERRRKIEPIMKVFSKYGAIAIFIFALTPLPDDLLLIPLGIMRLPFTKVFLPCFLGKTVMCFILAYGGRFSIKIIRDLIGSEEGDLFIIAVTSILLIVIIIIVFKVDWEKFLLEGGYRTIKLPFFRRKSISE
ncbi:MAG: VTT domain-containing protein [Candidatus Bathyarchaeia archaeon]